VESGDRGDAGNGVVHDLVAADRGVVRPDDVVDRPAGVVRDGPGPVPLDGDEGIAVVDDGS
jgi:hypothetical protein